MKYCFLVGAVMTFLAGGLLGLSGIMDFGVFFLVMFGGACAGDLIKRFFRPDIIISTSKKGLMEGQIFWSFGIHIAGAFFSAFVFTALLMESGSKVVLVIASLVSIGMIALNHRLSKTSVSENIPE